MCHERSDLVSAADLIATIDRIEENEVGEKLAVLVFDDGQELVVPTRQLPHPVRAGAVLRLTFQPDHRLESERRAEITRLQQKLFDLGG